MSLCKCGCNEPASIDFLPGHDQKLRTKLEQEVGGVLEMKKLVRSARDYADGDMTGEEFNRIVRGIFSKSRS